MSLADMPTRGLLELYRPSNGTEGDIFRERWCDRCQREARGRRCSILNRTPAYDVDDKRYPREWVVEANEYPGNPRCTAFEEVHPIRRCTLIRDKRQITMEMSNG